MYATTDDAGTSRAAYRRARANGEDGEPGTSGLGRIVTAGELLAESATPTRWIVEGWLAEGAAVLLGAHGGTGKSLLALQLAVCIAAGRPFLGLPTQQRRVMLLAAEDGERELRWRLHGVCRGLGIEPADLADRLVLVDQSRLPAELVGRGANGAFGLTTLYAELAHEIRERAVEVLIVDSASDAFGGSEIARVEVRRYITEAQRLVPAAGAVVHVVHVDKLYARGAANGQGYSGSTAWHNSVRQRWELARTTEEDEEGHSAPADLADPRRVLTLAKNNYGPAGATLDITFDPERGAFEPKAAPAQPAGIVAAIEARTARRDVLAFIAEAETAGDPVQSAEKANRNPYVRMDSAGRLPRLFRGRPGRARLFRELLAMKAEGLLGEREQRTAARHSIAVWTVTQAGKAPE